MPSLSIMADGSRLERAIKEASFVSALIVELNELTFPNLNIVEIVGLSWTFLIRLWDSNLFIFKNGKKKTVSIRMTMVCLIIDWRSVDIWMSCRDDEFEVINMANGRYLMQ